MNEEPCDNEIIAAIAREVYRKQIHELVVIAEATDTTKQLAYYLISGLAAIASVQTLATEDQLVCKLREATMVGRAKLAELQTTAAVRAAAAP